MGDFPDDLFGLGILRGGSEEADGFRWMSGGKFGGEKFRKIFLKI